MTADGAEEADVGRGERPAGVTALAVLALLDGLLRFLGGWGAMGAGGLALVASPFAYPADPSAGAGATQLLVAGFGAILVGLLELAFAWGAWTQSGWGWLLGLAAAGLAAVLAAGSVLTGATTTGPAVLGLLVPVAIAAYLLRPRTRRAFGLD